MPDVIGIHRPGRPSNDHARGFELALQAALNEASDNPSFSQLDGTEATIVFKAIVTKRNPVDIDGYVVHIQI
jgi:hypothetical protein